MRFRPPALLLLGALISASSVSAQVLELSSGEMHLIRPAQSDCFRQPTGDTGPLITTETECSESDGTAEVFVETTSLREVTVGATVRFVTTFTIPPAPEAAQQSFLPIFVRVPVVQWNALLFNGSRGNKGSLAQFSINARLIELLNGRAEQRDFLVDQAIFSAAHAGSRNCLLLATNPWRLVLSAANCVLNVAQRHGGTGNVNMSAVVQAGRTYTVELEVVANVSKEKNDLTEVGAQVSSSSFDLVGLPALKWTRMFITIGTDPQTVMTPHRHEYKTGRGKGHNKVAADTSLPSEP